MFEPTRGARLSGASTRASDGSCRGPVFDEHEFRSLLAVERTRAERSKRTLFVALVQVEDNRNGAAPIAPALAARMFSGLRLCVREMDIVGWFRRDNTAGALLTDRARPEGATTAAHLGRRITDTLRRHLPSHVSRRLHVRVLRLSSRGL